MSHRSASAPTPDWAFVAWVVSVVPWCGGAFFLLYYRHHKPLAFLSDPYVLFLRRFGYFSDRFMINVLLRKTPPRMPVAFLVPSRRRAVDWNPFIVGFAGLKFRHPFRSAPIVLRSRDDNWVQTAETLVRDAQIIILDMSESSEAIEMEFDMISKAGRWRDTVLLKEQSKTTKLALERAARASGVQVLEYKKDWIRALPRLVIGLDNTSHLLDGEVDDGCAINRNTTWQ